MKKLLYCVAVLLLMVAPSQAQLLWKISGKGLAQPSYLFGTHHLANLSIIDSIKGLRPAFESTKQVIGEIDVREMMSQQAISTMQKKMMLGGDSTLLKILTPAEFEKVDNCVKEYIPGVKLSMLQKLRPAALNNQLSVVMVVKQIGEFDAKEQLDSYFQREGLAKGKKVAAFETMEGQINLLLYSAPISRQVELLICLIDNIKKVAQDALAMTAYYNHQKLDKLYEISQKKDGTHCDTYQSEQDAMLKNRNMNWMKQIPTLIKENPSFIAVGALHLAGPDGLVMLLKKAGFNVTPVK